MPDREIGSLSIEVLAKHLSLQVLPWSNKLDLLDAALQRGLITDHQLTQISEPKPSDFALASSTEPLPPLLFSLEGWLAKNEAAFYGGCIGLLLIANIARLRNPFQFAIDHPVVALFGLVGLTLFSCVEMMFVGLPCYGVYLLIRWSSAPMRRYKEYVAARTRYDQLKTIRTALNTSRDARTWLGANGPAFERLVARYFANRGYKVKIVGGSNDGGIDIWISRDSEKAIVQCKAHQKILGPAVVRELYGAMQHNKAHRAYLATFNGVSDSAKDFARGKPIIVLTLDDFIKATGS